MANHSQQRIYGEKDTLLFYLRAIQEIYGRCFVAVSGEQYNRKNGKLPQIHQTQAASAIGTRTQMIRTKQDISAAMSNGAMQYPRTHKPWKNELQDSQTRAYIRVRTSTYTLPPSS